jgi:oligoribonuclease NrnB/cAMP/cGMP phosphodiesterase (DHH superfamily)
VRHLISEQDEYLKDLESLDKLLLVTHLGCLDGAGAAGLFIAAGGDPRHIVGAHPGESDDGLRFIDYSQYSHVLFADIAPREEDTIPYLRCNGMKTAVLDHHLTNMELGYFREADFAILDMERCGTLLMHDFLSALPEHLVDANLARPFYQRSEQYANLARMVDKADRSDTPPDEMDLLGIHMREVRDWWYTITMLGSDPRWKNVIRDDLEAVKAAQRLRNRDCENCLDRVELAETPDGVMAYVLGPSKHATYILKRVLRDNPAADFAVIMDMHDRGASIRARPGFDTTVVAAKFDGGGHAPASGFRVPWDPVRSLVLKMFEAKERT